MREDTKQKGWLMRVEIHFVRGLTAMVRRFRTLEPHEPNQSVRLRAVAQFPGFLQTVRVDDEGRDSTIVSLKCAGVELLERPVPALLFAGPRPFPVRGWCCTGQAVEIELLRDALPARWRCLPEA